MPKMPSLKKIGPITAAVLIIAILIMGIVGAYILFKPTLGTTLKGTVTLTYADGSQTVFNSANTLWETLTSQSILQANGQKLQGIKVDLNIVYSVTGAASSVTAQYWVIFYITVDGPAGAAVRANLPLFGRVEYWAQDYGTKSFNTNRWVFLQNNLGFGGIDSYYMEKGSGLQVGNINIGPDMAVNVNNAIGGNAIVGGLANALTTVLGTTTKSNGQTESLISWTKDGPTFYTDMWSIVYPYQLWGVSLPSGSLCIPYTGYCAGSGSYLRLHNGDSYSLKLKAAIFYRWQDSTGFWTPWTEKNADLASFNMGIADGWYTVLGISVGGGVSLW